MEFLAHGRWRMEDLEHGRWSMVAGAWSLAQHGAAGGMGKSAIFEKLRRKSANS